MISAQDFQPNEKKRRRSGILWSSLFTLATVLGVLSLAVLLFSIFDQSLGFVVVEYQVTPASLTSSSGKTWETMTKEDYLEILQKAPENFPESDVTENFLANLQDKKPWSVWTEKELKDLILRHIASPKVLKTWTWTQSLGEYSKIQSELERLKTEVNENALLEYRFWLNWDFIQGDFSRNPLFSGIGFAILGSLWIIFIALVFAFPLGIGSAIYLEEFARDNRFTRFIQTNIYNLAGVPSIVFGMLGLAVFVRALGPVTSGQIFGAAGDSGRTVLAAGLTLGILILPIIIINAQEALKAIPRSLRTSSLALGATRWQTIWHHVLPASMDRILTGTIFAVSRGIGETAPIIVVAGAAFLTVAPGGLFSQLTTLPISIFNLSQESAEGFKNLAGAGILVLLILLMGLNTGAILLRNKIKKKKESL